MVNNIYEIGAGIILFIGSGTMETIVGNITHYFPKIGVAVIMLEGDLTNGDEIHIKGAHSDFCQTVTSMQVEHKTITNAVKGQDIGMKVSRNVHIGDVVYKVG
jgi:putative protease